jgi:hypothetical protein
MISLFLKKIGKVNGKSTTRSMNSLTMKVGREKELILTIH